MNDTLQVILTYCRKTEFGLSTFEAEEVAELIAMAVKMWFVIWGFIEKPYCGGKFLR